MVPILVGIALLMVIICFGKASGAHFNPAISTMFYAKGDISTTQWWQYVAAQVAGGFCALAVYKVINWI